MPLRRVLAALAILLLVHSPLSAQEDLREAQMVNAAADGDAATVTSLLDGGFDVDRQMNKRRYTALMYASEFGRTEVVRLLLSRGANPRLVDYSGNSARAVAERKGHAPIVALLRGAEGAGKGEQRATAGTAQPQPERKAAAPAPAPAPAAAVAKGVAPREGRWRGVLHGITKGGGQSVDFQVRGGRIVSSTFNVDYHCAPQYVYRERMRFGFVAPIAVADGRFSALRREPAVTLEATGRFPTAVSAEGTFKMEDSSLCTTRLVRWEAKFAGR
jgi:hypothetical protein